MYTVNWKSQMHSHMYSILVFVKKKVKSEYMYLLEYAWNISGRSNRELLASEKGN